MGDLTANFNRSEFACKCGCGFDDISLVTVGYCQKVRDHFGKPVRVTSGCRCSVHNAAVAGTNKSRHMRGDAADIQVQDVAPADVADYCEQLGVKGLGRYETFTHLDARPGKRARWGSN